jgi:hypothetical protein
MKNRQLHAPRPRIVQRPPEHVLLQQVLLIAWKNTPEDGVEGFPQRRQVGDDDADRDFGYAPDGEGDGFVVGVFEAADAEVVAQFEGRDGRAACGVSLICVGGGRRAYSNDMRNTARTLHWTLLLSWIERMYTIGAVA